MKSFYSQTPEQALHSLNTSELGLSDQEAKKRLDYYGPNLLELKGVPLWRKLIEPFRSIFVAILFIAASTSYFLGENLDAIIIFVIISISAIIYYVQIFSAERVLRSLKKYEIAKVEVLRGGEIIDLITEQLVPGDIIRLYEGQKVPADARILHANNLRTDESMLTGESAPVNKTEGAISGEKETYDQKDMVFSGSFVVEGEVIALVSATGNSTEFGKIATLAQFQETGSPVQQKIDKLIEQIVAVVAVLAIVLLALSIYRGLSIAESLHFVLALAVSVVPEGLPVAISVVLVFGMRRMAKRKALVKNMAAIENIGLLTSIATDKTGTLTKNLLEIDTVWQLNNKLDLNQFFKQLTLSTNTKNNIAHDPLDEAFIMYSGEQHPDLDEYQLISSYPFNPVIAMSGNSWDHNGKSTIYVKGSPERILEHTDLTQSDKDKVEAKLLELSSDGLRVVALGCVDHKPVKDLSELGKTPIEFIALIAVADELRPESKGAIKSAQQAGITVRMITGDHFETAFSIGKQLGLCESRDQVFDSRLMKDMDDAKLAEAIQHSRVFARVIPENKHRILQILKQTDITAMTGDGVNDVPALTNAHIGLAMGSGSQFAKDAGDIVLLDNNFKSIVAAIKEGRKIFDNIRRMLFLLLTTSAGEALTFLVAILIGMPMPLIAVQILWINLVTDSAMAIPLGLEPEESDIMKRKPRKPKKAILGRVVITRMILIAVVMASVTLGLFAYFDSFMSEEYARTIAFTALVAMQWADAFNGRSLWQSIFIRIKTMNIAFYIGLTIAVTAQLLALFGPIGPLLSLESISVTHFAWVLVISFLPVLAAGELHKLLISKIEPDFR
jgi:P-type Ca2+ transporter type 2C